MNDAYAVSKKSKVQISLQGSTTIGQATSLRLVRCKLHDHSLALWFQWCTNCVAMAQIQFPYDTSYVPDKLPAQWLVSYKHMNNL